MTIMTIQLNEAELAVLGQNYNGRGGGFQSLMYRLECRAGQGGELELDDADLEQIKRYYEYDQGGFEGRLRKVFGRTLGPSLGWGPAQEQLL